MKSLERTLPGDLALPPHVDSWVGTKRLGGANQQGAGLRRGREAVGRTGPLCAVGGSGGVVDKLGGLGLGGSGGGRRVAQGALAGSHRGSSAGVCGKVS